jgi:hypothetical protein
MCSLFFAQKVGCVQNNKTILVALYTKFSINEESLDHKKKIIFICVLKLHYGNGKSLQNKPLRKH